MNTETLKLEDFSDVDWNTLIGRLGGHEQVHKDLGYPELRPRAVYLWRRRNSVPGRFVLPLIALASARKMIANLEDLPRIDPFAPEA